MRRPSLNRRRRRRFGGPFGRGCNAFLELLPRRSGVGSPIAAGAGPRPAPRSLLSCLRCSGRSSSRKARPSRCRFWSPPRLRSTSGSRPISSSAIEPFLLSPQRRAEGSMASTCRRVRRRRDRLRARRVGLRARRMAAGMRRWTDDADRRARTVSCRGRDRERMRRRPVNCGRPSLVCASAKVKTQSPDRF